MKTQYATKEIESAMGAYQEALRAADINIFIKALYGMGFEFQDCPIVPIASGWEKMPIIKAIRQVENTTGIAFSSLFGKANHGS